MRAGTRALPLTSGSAAFPPGQPMERPVRERWIEEAGGTTMGMKLPVSLGVALCLAAGSTASAGELVEATFEAKAYSGSRDRTYRVYVPDAVAGDEPVPLVMVLHGCRQTERNMVGETRYKDLADRHNFIVVYPFITSFDGKA